MALARARAASLSRGAGGAISGAGGAITRAASFSRRVSTKMAAQPTESRSTKMGAMMTSVVNSLVNFEELKPMRAWWKLLMQVLPLTPNPNSNPDH